MKFIKQITCIAILLLTIQTEVFADGAQDVRSFITQTSDAALQIIKSDDSSEQKNDKLTKIFNETVDIDWMAKFAVAKVWRSMTQDQRKKYITAYHNYLVKTYVPRFSEYNNQKIKIINIKDLGNDRYIVSTEIINEKPRDNSTVINVGYRCRKHNDAFKVIDLTGENFSLLATQRSEFAAVVEKGGIDLLITTLSQK